MAASLRNRALQRLNILKRNLSINGHSKHPGCHYHAASINLSVHSSKNAHLRIKNTFCALYRLQSTSSLGLSTGLDTDAKGQTVNEFITVVNTYKGNVSPIEKTTEFVYNEVNNATTNSNTSFIGDQNNQANGTVTAETSTNGVHVQTTEINQGIVNGSTTNVFQSADNKTAQELIPDPPPIPSSLTEDLISSEVTVEGLNTLTSVGLGGWFPPGIVQQSLNFLHESGALPWWLAIFVGTLAVRITMFPLVIYTQRNAAHVSNHMPQMHLLQAKMTDARRTGDHIETARYANELMKFVTEKKVNPLKSLVMPLVQAPVFISFFVGLRQMANLPLESMKDGGIYWFTDLTLADPYYILPLLTSLTLALTIEVGADGIKVENMKMARYVIRAMPIIIFPFTMNFPAGILCYWLSSNIISLGQVSLLKIPAVREYFEIPVIAVQSQELNKKQKKGFVAGLKETFSNAKITRELEERSRIDEVMFKRSGTGPVPKTYPYDPTKQKLNNNAVLTKKR